MVPMDLGMGNPSTESLQTITYTTECVTPHDPNLLKSQQSSPSNNHLLATVSISRTSSFNSGSSCRNLAVPTEVLAVHGAKNAALAATTNNTLLTADYDINNKLSPQPYKGE